jgi:hypothetical protein
VSLQIGFCDDILYENIEQDGFSTDIAEGSEINILVQKDNPKDVDIRENLNRGRVSSILFILFERVVLISTVFSSFKKKDTY